MPRNKKIFIVLAIPILFLLYALATISDYGINWDEPYHYRRGQAFLQYFLTGQKTYNNIPKYPPLKGDSDNPNFRNGEQNFTAVQINPGLSSPNLRRSYYQDDSWDGRYFIDIENTYGHPALNDVLAAISNKILYQKLGILGDLESYRLLIILLVSLTTFAIAIFMWKEYGIVESIFSSLAFASYPLLLGEQHFNIKDPVETAFYTLTIITAYLGIKKNKLSWLLISCLFFALGLSTKFNIVFSIFPLFIWFLYHIYSNGKQIRKEKIFNNILKAIIIAPLISIGILLLSYPTLWKNPIGGIQQIIKFYLEVGYPQTPTPGYSLFGFINTLPITWVVYTMPPIIIGLFCIAILFFRKIIKKDSFILLLVAWLIVTIGRNSLFGSLSYGGVRIIMEFIPAITMIAGISGGYLIKSAKNKKIQILIFVLIITAFVPILIKLKDIHPNENVYFNFLIGGLAGAKQQNLPFWGDSYGNAYFPGLLWINSHAEKNAKVSIPVGLISNIPRFKLRPDIALSLNYWSGLKHAGEYLIELTYNYSPENWFSLQYLNNAMIPVYEVKVDGVAIAKVWKNDPPYVKKEFTQTTEVQAKILSNPKNKTLTIQIPAGQKVMKISIAEPTTNCTPLKTGYVESSADSKTWTREIEDIAVNQLNREEIIPLTSNYEFLFFERNAKFFIFNTDNSSNCLLKATNAKVTYLTP